MVKVAELSAIMNLDMVIELILARKAPPMPWACGVSTFERRALLVNACYVALIVSLFGEGLLTLATKFIAHQRIEVKIENMGLQEFASLEKGLRVTARPGTSSGPRM